MNKIPITRLKLKVKSKIKYLYYTLKRLNTQFFIPKKYRFEYEFFENIRAKTYSDLRFKEARLRKITHYLDKTLVFDNFKSMDKTASRISEMVNEISKDINHDMPTINWSREVLAEYQSRKESKEPQQTEEDNNFNPNICKMLESIILSRRSIRSFRADAIPEETIEQILNAGLWAPSGCNRQTIEYLRIEDMEDVRYCQKIAGESHSFPRHASMNIIVLVDPRNYALPSQRHMAFLEGGAAVQNILLMAHAFNIGACWLFWHNTPQKHSDFIEKYGLKPWLIPVAMVSLGYVKNMPRIYPQRKELLITIHYPKMK